MNPRFRPALADIFLLSILVLLGVLLVMLSRREAVSPNTSGAVAVQATPLPSPSVVDMYPGPGESLPTPGRKPDETGVPTPFPSMEVTIQPITPVPFEKPSPPPSSLQPTVDPNAPWIEEVSRELMPRHIPIRNAEIIAIGTVKQVMPAQWTTQDGRRPANPHAANNRDTIFRPVLLQIEQYLRGEQPQPIIHILAYGGTVGQDTARVTSDNISEYREGDRVLVFLEHDQRGRSYQSHPLFVTLNRYTITPDGQATNSQETVPLQQLLDEIRAASPVVSPIPAP